MASSLLLATVLLLLLFSAAQPCVAQQGSSSWKPGRVTYYGAPGSVARAYDPTRGDGSFGILAYGSCGFTNSDSRLPFPREQPAASADAHPDYPGSCGRCYEIRCRTTVALNNQGQPIQIVSGVTDNNSTFDAFEGDRFRPVLDSINANVTDTQGRPYPGNSLAPARQHLARCYNEDEVHLIRITDSCPCTQVLKEGAPGVAKGGETRTQAWCCALKTPLQHFDISYYAFEKIAHPVYGVAMIEWRPVDCATRQPLPSSPTAYIDKSVIYQGEPRPGWSTFPQQASGFTLITPSAPAPSGAASMCLTMSPGGGLSLRCRECYRPGFQPFAGATSLSFWLRSNAATASESSTPEARLKMLLRKTEDGRYCGAEPTINGTSTTVVPAPGGGFRVTVPIEAFDCGGLGLGEVDQFDLQNTAIRNANVCVGDVTIDRA